jgi:hypothetical protein
VSSLSVLAGLTPRRCRAATSGRAPAWPWDPCCVGRSRGARAQVSRIFSYIAATVRRLLREALISNVSNVATELFMQGFTTPAPTPRDGARRAVRSVGQSQASPPARGQMRTEASVCGPAACADGDQSFDRPARFGGALQILEARHFVQSIGAQSVPVTDGGSSSRRDTSRQTPFCRSDRLTPDPWRDDIALPTRLGSCPGQTRPRCRREGSSAFMIPRSSPPSHCPRRSSPLLRRSVTAAAELHHQYPAARPTGSRATSSTTRRCTAGSGLPVGGAR